jgi:hypothetical protein
MKKTMKTLIALLVFVIFTAVTTAFAQDIIVLKNGEEIKAKVVEITPTKIIYKKFNNLKGPTMVIVKSDVFMIKYANGTKDVITSSNSPASTQSENARSVNRVPANSGDTGLYIMPLGFLQFGPVLGAEYAVTPNLSVDAHVRIGSLGLVMHALSSNDNGDLGDKLTEWGIGTIVKYYPWSVRNGFYFGGLAEYTWGTTTYYQGSTYSEYINKESFLAIAFNSGYKFDLSHSLYLCVGAILGGALPISGEEYYTHNLSPTNYVQKGIIFGMLEFTIGVNL